MNHQVKMRRLLMVVVLLGGVQSALAQDQLVEFDTSLDRTALWAGDLLEYRINLYHGDQVEILQDNLQPENLNLDPFTLEGLEVSASQEGEGHVFQIVFRLSAVGLAADEAAIPPVNLYYATRRPGSLGRGTEIETHTLVIPEKKIGLRSTLTSDSEDIRDAVHIGQPGSLVRALGLAGWVVLGLCVIQGALWSVGRYRQAKEGTQKSDHRVVGRQAIDALDHLGGETDGPEWGQRCQRVSEILKKAVDEVVEVDTASLTPEELREELIGKEVAKPLADQIYQVLDECEGFSYGHPSSAREDGDPDKLLANCREVVSELARL